MENSIYRRFTDEVLAQIAKLIVGKIAMLGKDARGLVLKEHIDASRMSSGNIHYYSDIQAVGTIDGFDIVSRRGRVSAMLGGKDCEAYQAPWQDFEVELYLGDALVGSIDCAVENGKIDRCRFCI